MSKNSKLIAALCGSVSAVSLFASTGHAQNLPAVTSPCTATQPVTLTPPPDVACLALIQVPGNKLNSFDISWVDSWRSGPAGGGRYYLADRSNAGIDIINIQAATFIRRLVGPFAGIVLSSPTAINNNKSGPNGVVSHNAWVYAGDGNSTLKVFNLDASSTALYSVSTVGPAVTSITRLDEMDITPDGQTLLAANNAEDPPFGTQFFVEGDMPAPGVPPTPTIQWSVDATIMPPGFGLSLEQPRWVPSLRRFVVGVPIINSNSATLGAGQAPVACNYGQATTAIPPCDGGLLVIDPTNTASVAHPPGLDAPPAGTIQVTLSVWNPATQTGMIPLNHFTFPTPPPAGSFYNGCGPNGVALNPNNGTLGLACTPGNQPGYAPPLVDETVGAVFAPLLSNPLFFQVNNDPSPQNTGGDEIWLNFVSCGYPMIAVPSPGSAVCNSPVPFGDQRFYVGASKNNTYSYNLNGFPTGTQTGAPTSGPVLGIMGSTPTFSAALGFNALPLIGTIPTSSGSHSVAADGARNIVVVPFVAPACKTAGCNTLVAGNLNVIGGDTTGNRQSTSNSFLTCGTNNGCIVLYLSSAQGTQN
jgi:hypothetical protein